MKLRLEHGLAYLEVILTFRGRSLSIRDTNRWPELSNMAKRYSGYFGLVGASPRQDGKQGEERRHRLKGAWRFERIDCVPSSGTFEAVSATPR
jgi:hypothetical protein